VINALRNGTEIPDRDLEALHRFAMRGNAFLAAGYTQRNVLEWAKSAT
jgi:hypothetical protein